MSIGSCPLNLAVSHATERSIRFDAGIPADQRLVMMIAFGYPAPDCGHSARSERVTVGTILNLQD